MLGLRNVLQVFHVEADPSQHSWKVAFVGERIRITFNAILTDQAGYTRKETGFTKLANSTVAGNDLFVTEDRMDP